MRICILTQPLQANYGGILQAYALQKVLKEMGHDVTTLRFLPPVSWVPSGIKKIILTLRRFASKYIKKNKAIIYCNPDRQTRFAYSALDGFIDKRIHCLKASAPLSLETLPPFDAYVVGSDQVWRPIYSPCLPNFYLDFLGDSPAKRIAYAASFGVDSWETDAETTALIRPLAQRFDAISVREASGVRLCADHLGVRAELMPDPTLLLPTSDYLSLCSPEAKEQEPYIASYILDKDDRVSRFVEKISHELKLPVKHIGQLDWSICADGPDRWLENIARASFVLTDSFHGTIFSLLFQKDFLAIINSTRGASRFSSLLQSVGIEHRLIDKNELGDYSLALSPINYEAVSGMIGDLRTKGRAFLKQNL